MIKNDGWAVTYSWVVEQKVEPITTGLPSEFTIECISYEYLQSICKNKYFITCMKVAYIDASIDMLAVVWEVQCTKTKLIIVS